MECEAVSDQSKRTRVDTPPGLAMSDNMLQEILSSVRNTDGQPKKKGHELDETLSAKTVTMATTTQDEVRNLSARVDALETKDT